MSPRSAWMRAAVLYGKQDVRLEQVPVPELEEGEVLIRIQAALTCGTDLKVFKNGSHARMIRPPSLFGHEFSGTIEAVGPGVIDWRPGQRVVAANSAPCRACFFCKKDKPNLCRDLLFVNGAYAEFLRLPARVVKENLLKIPEDLPFEVAALTEPLACVVRGMEVAQPRKGETVVILGSGPVGLLFAQLVSQAGAEVILIGKGERRLKGALETGAKEVLNFAELKDPVTQARRETPEAQGADLCIEAVGRPEAWSQAIQIVRPGGRVLLFGGCPSGTQVPLDTHRFHYDELTLLSVFHHTPNSIRQALRLLEGGAIRTTALITGEAPLSQLPEILFKMLAGQEMVKTAILP